MKQSERNAVKIILTFSFTLLSISGILAGVQLAKQCDYSDDDFFRFKQAQSVDFCTLSDMGYYTFASIICSILTLVGICVERSTIDYFRIKMRTVYYQNRFKLQSAYHKSTWMLIFMILIGLIPKVLIIDSMEVLHNNSKKSFNLWLTLSKMSLEFLWSLLFNFYWYFWIWNPDFKILYFAILRQYKVSTSKNAS